jgi:hypothetical protein
MNWLRPRVLILVLFGATFLFLSFALVRKHVQYACYSNQELASEAEAIKAAKKLIIDKKMFAFEEFGRSEKFVSRLDNDAKCCAAKRRFDYTYVSTVWDVDMRTSGPRYLTFVVIDGCGTRVLRSGSMGW